jgi:fructokinase
MGESAALPLPVVVGTGEILWDILPSGRHLGGAPANFAFHARSLGAEGVIVSAVGDDESGRDILETLRRHGMGSEYISIIPGVPTGRVTAVLDAGGVPEYVIHDHVAWDVLPSSPESSALAARADAVCFGTLAQRSPVSRRTIRGFLDGTKPECLRVFDVNFRQRFYGPEVVRDSLVRSRVLKLNEEELRTIAEMLSLPGAEGDILARLSDLFPLDLIALTRGFRGSRLFGRGAESAHPGFVVEIADTVGAGDAFTAALVVGLLEKKNLDEINERANRLAAVVCSRRGAWPERPDGLTKGRGDRPAGEEKKNEKL